MSAVRCVALAGFQESCSQKALTWLPQILQTWKVGTGPQLALGPRFRVWPGDGQFYAAHREVCGQQLDGNLAAALGHPPPLCGCGDHT